MAVKSFIVKAPADVNEPKTLFENKLDRLSDE
jgi:hypothetical protein